MSFLSCSVHGVLENFIRYIIVALIAKFYY